MRIAVVVAHAYRHMPFHVPLVVITAAGHIGGHSLDGGLGGRAAMVSFNVSAGDDAPLFQRV